ncbi:MAG: 6-carboxytetrahydropterin synthase, partial [Sulfolobales archaeon]
MRACIDGLVFEAAHYTPINNVPQLHGHTFTLSVCVEGELDKEFMVIDFLRLREILEGVIERYKYSLIVPRKDLDSLNIKGPFKVKLAVIDYPQATAEALSTSILDELITIFKSLNMKFKITLKINEGQHNYVE